MKKAYLFFATGFEEVEALTVVDILRRGGVDCKTVSIMGDYDVTSSHNVTVRADLVFEHQDLSDGDMLIMPGGIPGTPNLKAHKGLEALIREYVKENKYLRQFVLLRQYMGKWDCCRERMQPVFRAWKMD